MSFKVGDKAVYPAHGVGVIKRVETRRIGGTDQVFFVLEILSSGASLMVPAFAAERHGMRPLLKASEVERVFEVLSSPSTLSHTTWNRRFREFNDLIRSGCPLDAAAVARDLSKLRADKDLSYGEKKMLDKALSMLSSEVSQAIGESLETVEARLNAALSL